MDLDQIICLDHTYYRRYISSTPPSPITPSTPIPPFPSQYSSTTPWTPHITIAPTTPTTTPNTPFSTAAALSPGDLVCVTTTAVVVSVPVAPTLVVVVGSTKAVEVDRSSVCVSGASVSDFTAWEGGGWGGEPSLVVLMTETKVTVLCAKAVVAATRAAGRMVEGRILRGSGLLGLEMGFGRVMVLLEG